MKNLQPTLQAQAPGMQVAGVLQLLESQRSSGTFRLGDRWMRLRDGVVVKTSSEPVETLAGLLGAEGEFTFRSVSGEPTGPLSLGVTALLLECARQIDEVAK